MSAPTPVPAAHPDAGPGAVIIERDELAQIAHAYQRRATERVR
jgi:hypothetical protein